MSPARVPSHSLTLACCSRLVRTNITVPSDPSTWAAVLPEHTKDLLTGASALKVGSLNAR